MENVNPYSQNLTYHNENHKRSSIDVQKICNDINLSEIFDDVLTRKIKGPERTFFYRQISPNTTFTYHNLLKDPENFFSNFPNIKKEINGNNPRINFIQSLLKNKKLSYAEKNELLNVAIEKKNIEIIELFLKSGFTISFDNLKKTIQNIFLSNNLDLIEFLLKNPTLSNEEKNELLNIAIEKKNIEIIALFLKNGFILSFEKLKKLISLDLPLKKLKCLMKYCNLDSFRDSEISKLLNILFKDEIKKLKKLGLPTQSVYHPVSIVYH